MKIKEWIKENVVFRRDENEVRENKGYYATMGAAGLAAGIVAGIIIIILQFAVTSHDAQQNWINVVSIVALVAMIAFYIYMLIPVFKSTELDTASKVITGVISLLCIGGAFIAGIYITMLLFMVVAILVVLWLALKVWLSTSSSSSSSSYKAPRQDDYHIEEYKMLDGTTLTKNDYSDTYHGSDNHDYERNLDGSFSRTDE